jgi:hypothetical protein
MTRHLPFSPDYEREEAFALGVINGKSSGFPDTLRQFRIPDFTPQPDSLTPLAQGSAPPSPLPPAPPRRFASLTVSLSVGFAVGVVLAFAAISLRAPSHTPTAATMTTTPVPTTVAFPPPTPAHTAEPAPAARAVATPALDPPKPSKGPLALTAVKVAATPEQDRRWLLDLARSEQRRYRIVAAERLYRQILVRAPQDSEALSGLGELELLRGTVDLADQHFQAALDANSHYIPALIAAADIRWQSGRTEEARQAYLNIVNHYSADSYPPYVALRSVPTATPVCER